MASIQTSPEIHQSIIDEEHLRLLVLAHYVTGGLCILFVSIFLFHFAFMLMAALNPDMFPQSGTQQAPPERMFMVMAWVLGVFIVLGWTFGGLTIYIGRCIKRRAQRGLSMVVACLNLLFIPVGTLLGVCTLMVLTRSTVKNAYEI